MANLLSKKLKNWQMSRQTVGRFANAGTPDSRYMQKAPKTTTKRKKVSVIACPHKVKSVDLSAVNLSILLDFHSPESID